jgi:hypothetical protein
MDDTNDNHTQNSNLSIRKQNGSLLSILWMLDLVEAPPTIKGYLYSAIGQFTYLRS